MHFQNSSPWNRVRQSALLALLLCAVAAACWAVGGPNAAAGAAVAAVVSVAYFAGVSRIRHVQIARLTEQLEAVLHSGRRLEVARCTEGDVSALRNEVEKMVARLVRANEQLDCERAALADALADISHQIRTPLTAMELMTHSLLRVDDPEERRRIVRQVESLIDRVGWLVTTLLKIAKVDAGSLRVERVPVSVPSVVQRAIEPLEPAFDLNGVTLEVAVAGDVRFVGDRRWTAEALENVVKNCMEHTPAGGTVRVDAFEDSVVTKIVVTDTGQGVAPEDLPHVFERFYRGSASREDASDGASTQEPAGASAAGTAGSRAQGFGVGLALAQALVSAQGGTIRAGNAPSGGARFELAFPKVNI